jgi:hypothetical protein
MLFTCENCDELTSKGIEYTLNINYDIGDSHTYEPGSVLLIDLTREKYNFKLSKFTTKHELSIWFITEDSFTDNLDNDSFTYMKYIKV